MPHVNKIGKPRCGSWEHLDWWCACNVGRAQRYEDGRTPDDVVELLSLSLAYYRAAYLPRLIFTTTKNTESTI